VAGERERTGGNPNIEIRNKFKIQGPNDQNAGTGQGTL
jgi:hypothetical protein